MVKMLTQEQFNTGVMALIKKHMTPLDAIIHYCGENNLEYETVASLIGSELKQILRVQAEDLHFISRSAKLPV